MTQMIARDSRAQLEAAWKVLSCAHEHGLSAPMTLVFHAHDDLTTVQVDEAVFRQWYDVMRSAVTRTLDFEGSVHVTATGSLFGTRVELVTVMSPREECELSVDGWCATHSSTRGPVYCGRK